MADEPEETGKGMHFKTTLSKQSRNFSWEIENLQLWPLDDKKMTSHYFTPEPNLTFCATLHSKRAKIGTNIYCHLSFCLIEGDKTRINHIAVVTDSAGKVLHDFNHKSYFYQFALEERICELDPCPLDKLLKNSEDPVLIFKWTMEFVRYTESVVNKHTTTAQATSTQASMNVSNLINELKEMYIDGQNTDIILKVGDVDISVHKCILSKRSPNFAKMFENNLMEYKILDLELPVLQDLIEFLYSANLHSDDFESVHDLYHAADLYQVDDLRTTCSSVLLSKLDVENACRALVLAHEHQDIDFKKSVMDFISSNFNEIKKTNAYTQFVKEQVGLASEVILGQ